MTSRLLPLLLGQLENILKEDVKREGVDVIFDLNVHDTGNIEEEDVSVHAFLALTSIMVFLKM